MAFKLTINGIAQKDMRLFNNKETFDIVKTLDKMESIGQMGEPIHADLNVWVYRVGRVRIFFQKKGKNEIMILTIAKGIGPLVKKRCM